MRDDGTRWALVAYPVTADLEPIVINISEDAIPAAVQRRWIVLGRDSTILAADPIILSNPRRVADDE